MIGALLATVFLASALLGIFSGYIDVFFHRSELTRASQFNEACRQSKRLIARWIAEDSANRTDGDYVLLPPPANDGGVPEDVPYLEVLIGKGPYRRSTKYYVWDLRSETPPRENLVMRIVSPGRDGEFETDETSEYCKGDDLCCEATNDELMASQIASVLPSSPPSDGLDLPENFQWPENPLEQCLWVSPNGGYGAACTPNDPCSLNAALSKNRSCIVLKPGHYGSFTFETSGNPVTLIGEKANFEENCENTGNCAKIGELTLVADRSLAFIGLKIGLLQASDYNVDSYYLGKSFIGTLSFSNLVTSLTIQETVISGDLIWEQTIDEKPFNLSVSNTLVKGKILLSTKKISEGQAININISRATIDGCIEFSTRLEGYSSTPKFVLNTSNSTIKGIGCSKGIFVHTYDANTYAFSEIYLKNVKIGSEENILEEGFVYLLSSWGGGAMNFEEINFDNSTIIWANKGILFLKEGWDNAYGPVYLNNIVNYTNECFINEVIPNNYIHDDNLQCNLITN